MKFIIIAIVEIVLYVLLAANLYETVFIFKNAWYWKALLAIMELIKFQLAKHFLGMVILFVFEGIDKLREKANG